MRGKALWAAGTALAVVGPWTLFPASPAHADEECTPAKPQWVAARPAAFSQLGVQAAWQLSTGAGVTVAVVDTGINSGNDHLRDAVRPGLDLLDGGDGTTDTSGHGTAVAGVIAAREVDGSGLTGVAPGAALLPVRVYESDDSEIVRMGRGPTAERTAKGIVWAAEQGAQIILVPHSTSSDIPVLRAAVQAATDKGALVVASAGNGPEQGEEENAVRFPAGYDPVLSVTALDAYGNPSEEVNNGVHVEIAAPGGQVLTTFHAAGDCVLAQQQPSTSYAAGYVAATAALVVAAHRAEEPADWEYRLLSTALRPNRAERDAKLGWGIVAPTAAINFVNDGLAEGPPNPRFEAPAAVVPPVADPIEMQADHGPALRTVVAALAVGALAIAAAGLLLRRLRPH